MQLERLLLYRKIVTVGIAICMITIFFVPAYAYWIPEAYEEGQVAGWNGEIVFEDNIFRLLLLPFYILFPLSLVIKHKTTKIIIKVLLFMSGFLVLFVGMVCGMTGPDNAGDFGLLFILGIALLTGLMYIIDWFIWNRKQTKVENAT
ncbi:MAG: hypothetical protein H6582_03615 [Crocinitomicaceae bacterium]|nr:hypothetical protein [Crocinitomicaceae bacterium]